MSDRAHLNGCAMAWEDIGFLITGAPGSGKTSLCLALLQQGAKLVSDDQTILTREDEKLIARAPESIQSLIEVPGVGVLSLPEDSLVAQARLACEIALSEKPVERMPQEVLYSSYLGISLPKIAQPARETVVVGARIYALIKSIQKAGQIAPVSFALNLSSR